MQIKKKLALLLTAAMLVTSISIVPLTAFASATGSASTPATGSTKLTLIVGSQGGNGNASPPATGSTKLTLIVGSQGGNGNASPPATGSTKLTLVIGNSNPPGPGPTPATGSTKLTLVIGNSNPPGPTPGPSPYTPSYTPSSTPSSNGTIGDGSNNSGTNVSVTISNGNATVSNIPVSTINNIANTASGEAIVIDVSKTGSSVTKVTLTKSTLENISAALNSTSNNKDSLIIKTGKAEVEIDAKALSSIAGQARGNIQIVVEDKAEAKLNDSQKNAVRFLDRANGTSVEKTFEAYIVSGTTRISSFGGGEIAIGKIDYKIPAGKNPNNYFVYYLPESGAAERYVTWVKDGTIFFKTGHLSDYAIVYDETLTNGQGKEVYRLWNPKNGDHLLTTNPAERDACQKNGWKYEGVAFVVGNDGKKVYRLFNPKSREHFYTSGEAEKDALITGGWKLEATAFTTDGTKEVYRLYGGGMHLFTTSKAERDALVAGGWKLEGVAFKAN